MKKILLLVSAWLAGTIIAFCQLSAPQLLSVENTNSGMTVIVDFDGDGDPDIISKDGAEGVWGIPQSQSFWLYLNNGAGSFEELLLIDFGFTVLDAWGDYNNDGFYDIIYTDNWDESGAQSFFVKWGESNFSFSDPEFIFATTAFSDPIYYSYINGIAAGNVDNDQFDELVICTNHDFSDLSQSYNHVGFYYILNWNGSGFDSPEYFTNTSDAPVDPSTPFIFRSFRIDDFNGDAFNDIVSFVQSDFGADLYIYQGEGNGALSANPISYPGGWDSFDYGSLDEDAAFELVVSFANFFGRFDVGEVGLYEQDVMFQTAPDMRILDVNHDGLNDIAAGASWVELEQGRIYTSMNTGNADEDWDVALYLELEGQAISHMNKGDMNGDGFDDLIVVADQLVYVIYTQGSNDLTPAFMADPEVICGSGSVQFSDMSTGDLTGWNWTFEGGSPATSAAQNPVVNYSVPGVYDVTLTITNGDIEVSLTIPDFIEVLQAATYFQDNDGDGFGNAGVAITACAVPDGYVTQSGDCNDNLMNVNPTAIEACNTIDDDCDGNIDEGLLLTFYPDQDGDGFGAISGAIQSCSAPSGYIAIAGDCNDANAAVFPGATELCNGINDDCDASTDEGCPLLVPNDNPSGAITITAQPQNITALITGSLTLATPSSESQSTAVTGQDVWYKFIAPSPGIRIRAISSAINLMVELQDMNGNLIDVENLNSNTGNEFLNFGNLIEGNMYRFAVRNFNSAQGNGNFTLHLNFLRETQCTSVLPAYEYCQQVFALPVNASAYRFELTSVSTNLVYGVTQNYFTFRRLSTIPSLPAGDTYTLKIFSRYSLTNGLGQTETIEVNNNTPCNIVINPFTQIHLSDAFDCPVQVSSGATIPANQSVCRATDYQWEFTPVSPAGDVIIAMRGSILANFILSDVALNNGTTYEVRIRPQFSNGMFGNWGPVRCLQISSPGFAMEDEEPYSDEFRTPSNQNVLGGIYPNPGNGDFVMVRMPESKDNMLTWRVLDLSGALVWQSDVASGNDWARLEFMQTLAHGVYLLECSDSMNIWTGKLVVH
jgi:PKD repeat protein